MDQTSKLVSDVPKPEIISIDHDLDYYDLQQGSFNTFSVEDYNTLNVLKYWLWSCWRGRTTREIFFGPGTAVPRHYGTHFYDATIKI